MPPGFGILPILDATSELRLRAFGVRSSASHGEL